MFRVPSVLGRSLDEAGWHEAGCRAPKSSHTCRVAYDPTVVGMRIVVSIQHHGLATALAASCPIRNLDMA